jgi:hypothetical protein
MLAAALVAPGCDKVIPLEPEFITPQDGAEKSCVASGEAGKQDCENRAAKRWLWQPTVHNILSSIPSILATIFLLISRYAKLCKRQAGILSSPANRRPIP